MKVQTGDIIAVLDGRWTLAKIIQQVTRSKAHHTGMIVEINGVFYVSEMEKEGHLFTRWDGDKYNSGNPEDRTLVGMRFKDGIDPAALVAWCMDNTEEYDFLALLQHLVHRYFRLWIGRRSSRAANRFTCSEWVAFTFNTFTGLFPKWWKTTPADIATMYPERFDIFWCKP